MSTPAAFVFPVVINQNGLQPQSPASLQQQLLTNVASTNPGYTANLPGIMVEDISSTEVAGIALCDQAKVELVNSLTPNAANEFLLSQLGQIYLGQAAPGLPTNTSVPVVFAGTAGYVVPNGFLVGDGTNVYQVQGGGVIAGGGTSQAITAISINPGAFGVPANTVTTLLTSAPSVANLSVNNPTAGSAGNAMGETWASFRARVLQAGRAASVGTTRYIKTLLGLVPGVTSNLISVQQATGGLRVIATGGDVYQIAYAIFMSVGDPAALQGSAVSSGRNVTVSLIDYPDTYPILFVNTQQQTVTMVVTWNTSLASFTGGGAFASLVQPPLVAYLNALAPGQVINVLEMNAIFQAAIAGVLNPTLLTRLVFAVNINGVLVPPGTGTYAVTGDPESHFFTALNGSGISVLQG